MTQATLGEGNTPLVASHRIGPRLGLRRLLFKLEQCNPTGSYKDRFIAAEVTRVLAAGARGCVATSSGNTGSSLAAYAARYALPCAIVVNESAPSGKLVQMQAHGASLVRVRDFIDSAEVTQQVLATLSRMSQDGGLALIVSAYRHCPVGMAGVEPIGRELADALGAPPAHVFVPVGGGGLYSAVARGLEGSGARVHAVQPAGCLTVVAAWERGTTEIVPVRSATKISGLAVPFDIDAGRALEHLRACGGLGIPVEDPEVWTAQRLLLAEEGIYCEPAGAAALAGLLRALDGSRLGPSTLADEPVVCVVTGHGFKDPDSIAAAAAANPGVLLDAGELEAYLQARMAA
ncbi:MAG: pyridoxal-phosphate dependent enzyme [Bryobacterales bacterium]|nr:pyridoxal-phosphate dependent enzyme [Bryobacterales bacterium]